MIDWLKVITTLIGLVGTFVPWLAHVFGIASAPLAALISAIGGLIVAIFGLFRPSDGLRKLVR